MTAFVKCLVWDLDNTLWDGILLEGDDLVLRPNVPTILEELGQRGILSSIASRNEEQSALSILRQFGLEHYFVAPQINTNPKAENLQLIADSLNLGLDSLAFIDDSPFEREAVTYSCPSVLVIEAKHYEDILDWQEFNPPVQTAETRQRTRLYQDEAKRQRAEEDFRGARLDFLKSCKIRLLLRPAKPTDLPRIVELSNRTNQFNSTGIRYSANEIATMIDAPDVWIIVGELSDRFGDYGKIGVVIMRLDGNASLLESVMISCRAAGRGVPAAMLILALRLAQRSRIKDVRIKYRPTKRNRQLGLLYNMLGFQQMPELLEDEQTLLAYDLSQQSIPEVPEWLALSTPGGLLET